MKLFLGIENFMEYICTIGGENFGETSYKCGIGRWISFVG